MDYKLSSHTQDMLKEREIPEEWVWRTLDNPDLENVGDDNNTHYFKRIDEHEGEDSPCGCKPSFFTKEGGYSIF